LKAGLGRADFNQANAAAARHLAKKSRAEVYFISDFQRKNWANVNFTAIPTDARVFFVEVSNRLRENRGILSASINQSQILAGETVMLEVEVGNYTARPME